MQKKKWSAITVNKLFLKSCSNYKNKGYKHYKTFCVNRFKVEHLTQSRWSLRHEYVHFIFQMLLLLVTV